MRAVESYVRGRWLGAAGGVTINHAVTGEPIATISSAGVDFAAAAEYGRAVGGPALRELTFHDRAGMLRALGKHLLADTAALYELSTATGATRTDSWVDIEGGAGVLMAYSGVGRREMPNAKVIVDGEPVSLSRDGSFLGAHIIGPRPGVAVHINAFNFPCWGMLEKLAPTFLAGMPMIVKPGSQTAYLTELMVRSIIDSGILPEGSLQLISGSAGDLLDHLGPQDAVAFTGSADTARRLRTHPTIIENSVRFNAEADSLNAAILGESAVPGSAEFDLFIAEVVKEMTTKAGQKCTAIRRVIVPSNVAADVEDALTARLAGVRVGDPAHPDTDMGALASLDQRDEVRRSVAALRGAADVILDTCEFHDIDVDRGAFLAPTLLRASDNRAEAVHSIEAFGPVTTIVSYDGAAEAIELAALGKGSLVASVFTPDDSEAAALALGIAAYHGRVHVVDEACGATTTGHGSPMPQLVHGGPGRAGGGEELGGVRSVHHYMQRTAIQGSPDKITAITGRWTNGSRRTDNGHPFTLHFEDLQIGDAITTESRTITIEDIEAFAELTGDFFYAHMDEEAAKASPIFNGRVAHGYLVLSIAAGLFVWAPPGPVLANTGLDNLRFAAPSYPGDELIVHLTAKEKSLRAGSGYGEVRWDAQVVNQRGETAATYELLTMVASRPEGDAS
jgi:oxepin-CoA hydrolase/3-oxo-5,6-dehydrosuberyl-CoA semialdehyde dehydrogenase